MARQRDPHLRKRVDTGRLALRWESPWSDISTVPGVVSALRESLPGTDTQVTSPVRPVVYTRFTRAPAFAVLVALFIVITGAFSVWPTFQLLDDGMAMVSLSFSHAGQRIRECRKLSQEELNKLPPNMRKPDDCPRERLPVYVSFKSGEQTLYEATRRPTGLWKDGAANIYQRLEVEAGSMDLFIGMNESGKADGFDYSTTQHFELAPGDHVVVEFDQSTASFVFKQE